MYRVSRNIEASIIDYVKEELVNDNWSDIRVEKVFAEVYNGSLPCICINVVDSDQRKLEIGSSKNRITYICYFRIFGTSDGNRLDLSDWLVEKLENSINYYQYTIISGIVSNKELKGKINIFRITDNRKELVNTENLEQEDRYRHLIVAEINIAI